jgi:hypothetical protein
MKPMQTITKITFAKHVRSRANSLINILPFPHHYQRVLSAIANLDWQQSEGSPAAADSLIYLQFADISDTDSAIRYLDWLEPQLRKSLSIYEQMVECHKQELERFYKTINYAN